ncbi:hypothetical protein QCA50_000433 [Cerrena zonata]|uniref:MARVEL domain-containing protein n=1 Tax=Cerrena zonata TaxID=2478898 RepID=A0AAW0GX28_9APHY
MTQLFRDMRTYGYVAILLFSAAVLGIDAYFASIFLPNLHRDFTIFAIVVPSLTILVFIAILSWSQPRVDAFILFILGSLWLAMGAWSADIIGTTQCDALTDQTIQTKNGTLKARSYCYEMKVIEAFSWLLFCLFAICFFILISLTTRSKTLGRPFAWREPIVELPWFNQWPGWPEDTRYPGSPGGYAYPAGVPMTAGGGMTYGPWWLRCSAGCRTSGHDSTWCQWWTAHCYSGPRFDHRLRFRLV